MRVYASAARLIWPRSYAGKILLASFVGAYLPILLFTIAAIALPDLLGAALRLVGILLLLALLAGTAASMLLIRALLEPLRLAERALEAYRTDRRRPHLPTAHSDEAGRLLAGIQRTIDELDGALAALSRQSLTDPLTMTGNRRWLMDRGGEAMSRAERTSTPLAVVVFKLDDFPELAKAHGHSAGDNVLIEAVEIVRAHTRPYDLLARIGAAEFCLILPDSDLETAVIVADRIRMSFAGTSVAGLPAGTVTASFGVAARERDEKSLAAMMARADDRLYLPNGEIRDAVHVAPRIRT